MGQLNILIENNKSSDKAKITLYKTQIYEYLRINKKIAVIPEQSYTIDS